MLSSVNHKIMVSAIERLRRADQQLAIVLSDLKLIQEGRKSNGGEVARLLNEIEKVKHTLANTLTLAINRHVFDDDADETK